MRDGDRNRQGGITLMETTAAVAMIGLATLAASSLLAVHPRAAERVAAQKELLRVVEATVESVRAGALPLASGSIEAPIPTSRPVGASLVVRALAPAGLYELTATASTLVRGHPVERSLSTMLWRRP
jgi:type II secretory pathway pseudopilin PulG